MQRVTGALEKPAALGTPSSASTGAAARVYVGFQGIGGVGCSVSQVHYNAYIAPGIPYSAFSLLLLRLTAVRV